jgi:hypothetical protein
MIKEFNFRHKKIPNKRIVTRDNKKYFGGLDGARTHDHWLKRPVLYQLSYKSTDQN